MPHSVQDRSRVLRRRTLDQDEAFDEYAQVFALRLARNLSEMANTVADRLSLAVLALPILGIDADPEPTRLKELAPLLAGVRPRLPRRIGPAFANLDFLTLVLRLNATEVAVLELAIVVAHHGSLSGMLERVDARSRSSAARKLAAVLDCDPAAVLLATSARGSLVRLCLLNPFEPHATLDTVVELPSDVLLPLTEYYARSSQILDAFVRTSAPSTLSAADFPHCHDDLLWLARFLRRAVRNGLAGVNVLLYGHPGTGKTEFAKVLAQAIAGKLYEVRHSDNDSEPSDLNGRLRAYQLAQACLERNRTALLLFDEAEDVFGGSGSLSYNDTSHGYGKAFMNALLESNAVPTIWITNAVQDIDAAFRRRFDYSVLFNTPPREVRGAIVRKQFAGLPLTDDILQQLAADEALTPGQIARAARAARVTNVSGDQIAAFVGRSIRRSSELLGLAPAPPAMGFTPRT